MIPFSILDLCHIVQGSVAAQAFRNPLDLAQAGQHVVAVPGAGLKVPIWILGFSTWSAQFAAVKGFPFAFALQQMLHALELYGAHFKASEWLDKPYAMLRFVLRDGFDACEEHRPRERGGRGGTRRRKGHPASRSYETSSVGDRFTWPAASVMRQPVRKGISGKIVTYMLLSFRESARTPPWPARGGPRSRRRRRPACGHAPGLRCRR